MQRGRRGRRNGGREEIVVLMMVRIVIPTPMVTVIRITLTSTPQQKSMRANKRTIESRGGERYLGPIKTEDQTGMVIRSEDPKLLWHAARQREVATIGTRPCSNRLVRQEGICEQC
jgi:hypothetical protein